ncbi:hypothetical protein MRBLMC3_000157 [Sphingobium sp. LMC3-1-1.1]|uniref:hypothetical protein n=1 Tax=Sphingobium sp. LMC3-1-1.1 TaxID=3135241 RepID=UPI00344AE5BB
MPIKIADTNFLRDDRALAYLSTSRSNRIGLTDTVLVEMHKKRPDVTVPNSLVHLSRFPKQVIVIKQFPQLYHFPIRSTADVRRMIDGKQTGAFPRFVAEILNHEDREVVELALKSGHHDAQLRMKELEQETKLLPEVFKQINSRFRSSELEQLRLRVPYGSDTQRKLIDLVFDMSRGMFKSVRIDPAYYPRVNAEVFHFLVFRYALCVVLLYTRWVHHGQQMETKISKLINDVNDAHIASIATYFGGVLSDDAKLCDIHREARYLLRVAPFKVFVG